MNCIICKSPIKHNNHQSYDFAINAIEVEFTAEYGSDFDGDYGRFFICDQCFKNNIDDIVILGNYVDNYTEAR